MIYNTKQRKTQSRTRETKYKFFFDKEKQKHKTIKQLHDIQNNETKIITSDYEILKYCKIFFSNLYTKTQTNTKNTGRITKTNST